MRARLRVRSPSPISYSGLMLTAQDSAEGLKKEVGRLRKRNRLLVIALSLITVILVSLIVFSPFFLPSVPVAHAMAPDGSVGAAQSSGTITLGLTTSNSNDVIIISVGTEDASGYKTVSSISSTPTNLTFTKRKGPTQQTWGGGGRSVAKGTKITMADLSAKNVEDVKVGDEILSYDVATGNTVQEKVLNVFPDGVEETISLNGLVLTSDQQVLTVDGLEYAGNVVVGNYVLGLFEGEVKPIEITQKQIVGTIETYDLTVANTHLYFANNIIVHNMPSFFESAEEWYSTWSSSGTITITVTLSGTPSLWGVGTVFGISGADTSTIFDINTGANQAWAGSTTNAAVYPPMNTTNSNDFIIGLLCIDQASNQYASNGFTNILNGTDYCDSYFIVTSPQTSLTVNWTSPSATHWVAFSDAVMQAATFAIDGSVTSGLFSGASSKSVLLTNNYADVIIVTPMGDDNVGYMSVSSVTDNVSITFTKRSQVQIYKDYTPPCMGKGTQVIMSDNSTKNIEDVKIGDEVLSFDTQTHSLVAEKVLDTFDEGMKPVVSLNGLVVTQNQVFMTADGLSKTAEDINVGDHILQLCGGVVEPVEITSKVYLGSEEVYDLTVANTHLFFCNGLLVHNAGTVYYQQQEEWYAVWTGSGCINITVAWSKNPGHSCDIMAFGISGANTTTIFDSNANANPNEGDSSYTPTVTGLSTSNANDLILGMCFSTQLNVTANSAGFTQIMGSDYYCAEDEVVSSTQSSISVAFHTNMGTYVVDTAIADSIMQAGGGGGGFSASITVNTVTHSWTITPGQNNVSINENSGYISLTVTASANFDIGANASGPLTYGSNTIALSYTNMSASGWTNAIALTTTMQTIPGLSNVGSGSGLTEKVYLWLSCPTGVPAGAYTETVTFEIIQHGGSY